MSVQVVLARAIMDGKFDDQLDQLTSLVQRRRELVGQQLLVGLSPGDRVRFNARTRPQYLRGYVGIVQRVSGDRAYVVLEVNRKVGRFSAGAPIGTSAVLLERV